MSNNEQLTAPAVEAVDLVTIRLDKLRFPRLANISKEQALPNLNAVIVQALMLRGQQATEEMVAFISSTLYDQLIADEDGIGLKYLTLEEIRREVKAAALGRRGEIYGVNVASLYKILSDYALGAGHVAQEEAARRRHVAFTYAVESGLPGKVIGVGAQRILEHSHINKNTKH